MLFLGNRILEGGEAVKVGQLLLPGHGVVHLLLERVNAIPGDFLIRFMTSHPKDATLKLFRAMAECRKVAPVLP